MSTIQRYVLWEILKVFLLCLGVTVLIMTLVGGVSEGMRKGLPPLIVGNMLPYFVPEMLRYTVPGCMLFAVCTTFGRMSAYNEITAIKSAGINPFQLAWPVLVLAYFFSFLTYWDYDICADWARPNIHRTIVQSLDETAYGMLRTKKNFSVAGINVSVKKVEGDRLISPKIQLDGSGDDPDVYVEAAEAELKTDPETGILMLTCWDGRIEAGGSVYDFNDKQVYQIDHLKSIEVDPDFATPANLPLRLIPAQIQREQKIVSDAQALLETDEVKSDSTRQAQVEGHIRHHQLRLYRLQTEKQRRLSNGFGCFCFVFVGIPVATWWKSSDNISTFFVCFLPILLAYYPLLVVGEKLAREGYLVPLPVWIADATMLAVGGLIAWRVNRN